MTTTREELHNYLLKNAAVLTHQLSQARRGLLPKTALRDAMNVMDGRLRMAYFAGIVSMGDDTHAIVAAAIVNAKAYLKERK